MEKPIKDSKKLSLAAPATFKATVAIPIPGNGSSDVEFTFKYRTKDEFKEFVDSLDGGQDIDVMMDIICGWDLDEAFDADSVAKMLQLYMGAGSAILSTYMGELTGARLKNL